MCYINKRNKSEEEKPVSSKGELPSTTLLFFFSRFSSLFLFFFFHSSFSLFFFCFFFFLLFSGPSSLDPFVYYLYPTSYFFYFIRKPSQQLAMSNRSGDQRVGRRDPAIEAIGRWVKLFDSGDISGWRPRLWRLMLGRRLNCSGGPVIAGYQTDVLFGSGRDQISWVGVGALEIWEMCSGATGAVGLAWCGGFRVTWFVGCSGGGS